MNSIFVIAEAGVNHNGDMYIAKKLIDVAVKAGADAVKFQTFVTELGMTRNAPKAVYQKKSSLDQESQFEMVKKLELSKAAHIELIDYCDLNNILFLSTPFDHESIDLLNGFNMQIFKIPSGEITNLPYLRKVGGLKKRVILSTGMATLDEIAEAINVLHSYGTKRELITVLHATTEYPCPMESVNLKAMLSIKKALGIDVGYSDHTIGIEIPIAAAALGATVIEKHFTLNKNMDGPDHQASIEPDDLSAMIKAIRKIEIALGDGIKNPSAGELLNKLIARKSLVANKLIKMGEKFTDKNLAVKRPGTGISPMKWDEVIGKNAIRDFLPDEFIEL